MLTTTVCVALSAAGLAVALLTAWRRRFVGAARIAAVALLPVGLAMAGLLGLAGDIGAAAADWAASLVLRPTVWGGFAVLAGAVVLWAGARIGARRRRTRGRSANVSATPAATARSDTAALGTGGEQAPAVRAKREAGRAGGEDFSDIEAILKKHGI